MPKSIEPFVGQVTELKVKKKGGMATMVIETDDLHVIELFDVKNKLEFSVKEFEDPQGSLFEDEDAETGEQV